MKRKKNGGIGNSSGSDGLNEEKKKDNLRKGKNNIISGFDGLSEVTKKEKQSNTGKKRLPRVLMD